MSDPVDSTLVRPADDGPATVSEKGAPRPAAALAAGTRVGRYVIKGLIARGGMGAVHAAHDPELNRDVAVKLVRLDRLEGSRGSAGQARLVREAQSLARLNHPNVVAVYDVGQHDDGVFVAMELVDGVTAAKWVKDRDRTGEEILRVYLEAARGLWAAHQAGLVHRDFKPQNLVVTKEGHAKVLDFGLARPTELAVPGVGDSGEHPAPLAPESGTANPEALTVAGSVLGTPGYMSPEQREGLVADARSDQFSFCVSLYEALHGVRPFEADSVTDTVKSERASGPRAVLLKRPGKGPAHVRAALERGLATDPSLRFADLGELIATLERDPRRRRRQVMAVAFAAAAVLGSMGVVRTRDELDARACRRQLDSLGGAWSAAAQQEAKAAFTATGQPLAGETFEVTQRTLSDYGGQLVATRCAAPLRKADDPLSALRKTCLERRRSEAAALATIFRKADKTVVDNAAKAVNSLAPASSCDDVGMLARLEPPVPDAERARSEALRLKLAEVQATRLTGQFKPGLAAAEQILAEAKGLKAYAVAAEASLLKERLQDQLADYKGAEQTSRETLETALLGAADLVVARAMIDLTTTIGFRLGRPTEGEPWLPLARAALARVGNPPEALGELLTAEGALALSAGKAEVAERAFRDSASAFERAYGPGYFRVASALSNLAIALGQLGRNEEGLQTNQRALELRLQALGPNHPDVALSYNNLCATLTRMERFPEAAAYCEKAVQARTARLGPDHVETLESQTNLALVFKRMGEVPRALALHTQAVEKLAAALGADHPRVAAHYYNQSEVLLEAGKVEESLPYLNRAIAITQEVYGPDHPELARFRLARADSELSVHKLAEARADFAEAIRISEKRDDGPRVVRGKFGTGIALWLAGQRAKGITEAKAARALAAKTEGAEAVAAAIDLWLAKPEAVEQELPGTLRDDKGR